MKPFKKGYSLLAAILIMLVMSVFSLGVVTMISSDAVSSIRNYQSNKAFYIATAYAECYLRLLKNTPNNWSVQPQPQLPWRQFLGGDAWVVPSNVQPNSIEFEANGQINVNGQFYRRRLHYKVTRDNGFGIFNQYMVYWSGGVNNYTWLAGNTTVYGSVFLNGDLGLGPMTRVVGDVNITGDISYQGGSTVEGRVVANGASPASYPTFDPSSYNNEINLLWGLPFQNIVWWGNQIISGYYPCNGDLIIQADTIVTVNAPAKIVVTGKVIIGNNVRIGDNVKIIANQTITTGSNLQLGRNCVFYANDNLEIGNNSHLGSDIEPDGGSTIISLKNVTYNSEIQFFGFVYAAQGFTELGNNTYFQGNLVTSNFQSSSLNATFRINPNLVDFAAVGMRPDGGGRELSIDSWGEEY